MKANNTFAIRSNSLRLAVFAALSVVAAGSYAAGSTTSNLAVSASVSNNCLIDASGGLAFGAYDPVSANAASDLDSSGTIAVTCTNGASAAITLGQGANAAGGSTDAAPLRQMNDGGLNNLSYNLYTDNSYATVWDISTGVAYTGTGAADSVTVYGRVSAGQNVPAGSYSDTVVATITF